MTYCRWSEESDVYVFLSANHINCFVSEKAKKELKLDKASVALPLKEDGLSEMINYLKVLKKQKLRVPDQAFDRLNEDIKKLQNPIS